MKIKTQLMLASVITSGLLASGCSQQMVAQQTTKPMVIEKPIVTPPDPVEVMPHPQPEIQPLPRPEVKPQPQPQPKRCWHGRNSRGECNPGPRVKKPVYKPKPQPQPKRCWHGRNAKGECNPAPGTQRPVYKPRPAPHVMPKVKAKGTYRGAIPINQGVLNQYQY